MPVVELVYEFFLNRGNNIKWMNAIAGSLMIGVGLWLAFGHG
jgi:threonine/homoserine/homoserine lactone efflux protein